MALKRSHDMMAAFSMASMTDVIFLLLIFFMVTSTFVFPTALEVNLPQSTQQTAVKPGIRIYLDKDANVYASKGDVVPDPIDIEALPTWLQLAMAANSETADATGSSVAVALYADEAVPYGRIVDILNIGAAVNIKIVLATKPVPTSAIAPVTVSARQQ